MGRDFEQVTLFRHGLAVVREGNLAWLIDLTGRVVSAQYEDLLLGNDPQSPTIVKQNGLFGILYEGKTVFLPEGRIFEPFSCGRAILQDSANGYAHFIGPDGTKLFGTSYWRPQPFVLNRAAVQLAEGSDSAWIDREGKIVFRWSAAGPTILQEQMGLPMRAR